MIYSARTWTSSVCFYVYVIYQLELVGLKDMAKQPGLEPQKKKNSRKNSGQSPYHMQVDDELPDHEHDLPISGIWNSTGDLRQKAPRKICDSGYILRMEILHARAVNLDPRGDRRTYGVRDEDTSPVVNQLVGGGGHKHVIIPPPPPPPHGLIMSLMRLPKDGWKETSVAVVC